MVELIPYFAGLIMLLFGTAFYLAMITFRGLTEEKEDPLPQKLNPAAATPNPRDKE